MPASSRSGSRAADADQRDAALRLDVRVFLIVGDEADARIVLDVLGVFRQRADEDEQAAVVIHQIRRDGAERVAVEFFRQGAQRAVTMGAQQLACITGGGHGELVLSGIM